MSGAAPASLEHVKGDEEDSSNLSELLNETRILLPGTEIFLAFLMTLPFTNRFESLSDGQRLVYLATFFMTLAAFACLVAPAAYHRIARPIRDKARFKIFATKLLVIGLAPASVAFVLVTYLVSSVVTPQAAVPAAGVMAGLILVLWWAIPIVRIHDKFPKPKNVAGHAAE
jgi:hypothetical protein